MKALISVSDKTGVVEFAKGLVALGWEILSTSGTMKLLKESGVPVTSVSDVTGFPEICDGRVKTLHPKIHGALLARRDIPEHMKELKDNDIETIDLVCVNLYPFRETIAKPDVTMEDAVEHIDIGGPSMLRSAAKNWESVTVVCNPADYETVLSEIKAGGNTTRETRLKLSAKAYTHTAEYDMAISTYMRAQAGLPEKLFLEYDLKQELRYGENPHQEAKFFASTVKEPFSLATAEQLNGKELSYNNIQDANATLNIAREFDEPFCVGVKHMNPCGSATGKTIAEAWKKAYEADKTSIFGGIVAANREIDLETAQMLKPTVDQLADMEFAWKIVKHVKSNAIVVAKGGMTYGVGAGQMNRIGSAEIALKQAQNTLKEEGKDIMTEGLVLASDGFFPFNDCVALAAEYGIKAIVQPGGSIRDEDSIKLANEKGITMLFTGERHFKH